MKNGKKNEQTIRLVAVFYHWILLDIPGMDLGLHSGKSIAKTQEEKQEKTQALFLHH